MHPSAVHGTCGCIVLRAFAASSAELAEELPQCLSLGLVDCPDLCYGPVRGWKEELPIELLWPCLPHRSHGFECWGDLWHGRSGRHGRLGGSGCTHHRPFGAWPHSLHIPIEERLFLPGCHSFPLDLRALGLRPLEHLLFLLADRCFAPWGLFPWSWHLLWIFGF
ncbi:unnamed protein product [Durusdinium trenchii]|uniref:Uncharacterized protein n=2 Tax=Durusdinium trenchii TaxID=1381693 RepID=A0ABP0Q6E9_9DINO